MSGTRRTAWQAKAVTGGVAGDGGVAARCGGGRDGRDAGSGGRVRGALRVGLTPESVKLVQVSLGHLQTRRLAAQHFKAGEMKELTSE